MYARGRLVNGDSAVSEVYLIYVQCFGPCVVSPQVPSKWFPRSTAAVICYVGGCFSRLASFLQEQIYGRRCKPMQIVRCFLDGSDCPSDSDGAQVEHGNTRTRHKQPDGQNRVLAIETTRPEGDAFGAGSIAMPCLIRVSVRFMFQRKHTVLNIPPPLPYPGGRG